MSTLSSRPARRAFWLRRLIGLSITGAATLSAAQTPNQPAVPPPEPPVATAPAPRPAAAPPIDPTPPLAPPAAEKPATPPIEKIDGKPQEKSIDRPPEKAPEKASDKPVDPETERRYSTNVLAERPMTAASAFTVREQDLRLRPVQRVSDLLRVAPGLITVQHAGGGKANQLFLRGFDADHGTDVALHFDGVPVNMVSHGHGQGYSDTNFLIPELIERVDVYKGPYFAEWGDLATAGAINLQTKKSFGENSVTLSGGMWNTLRGVIIASPTFKTEAGSKLHPLVAGEFSHTDGPFQNPEGFKKYNILAKLTYDISSTHSLSIAVSSYGGDWRASGQIPSRAVDAGRLDFFGYIDPTEGGTSARQNVWLTYRVRPTAKSEFAAVAYVTRYTFKLYSNFTLYSRDPINGDGIEQGDERILGGLRAHYRRRFDWRWFGLETTVGVQGRFDDIHNTLYYQKQRERLAAVADHDIRESSLAGHAKVELFFSRWVRLIGALRADMFLFDVTDNREDLITTGTKTSGVRSDTRFSPKATLVVSPHRSTDFFVNFGYGFHSNDARGVVRGVDPVTPLTPALGYEVGARTRLFRRLDLAASFWGLDLDSELVWVGDEGVTEDSGATRRLGFEGEARLRITSFLFADLDVTYSDSRFKENAGNGNSVALAPRLTVSAGLSASTKFGLRGAVRMLGITDRPATEDEFLIAQGFLIFDASVSYRYRFFELGLSVENFTNRHYKLAQFATVSRLPNEPATGVAPPPNACPQQTRPATADDGSFTGCQDINFSPGNPINVQARLTTYF